MARRIFAFLIFGLISSFAHAEPDYRPQWVLVEGAPSYLRPLIQQQYDLVQARVAIVKDCLDFLHDKYESIRHSPASTPAERNARTRKLKQIEQIANAVMRVPIYSQENLVVPHDPPRSAGQFGQIHKFKVIEIIKSGEALVEAQFTPDPFDLDRVKKMVEQLDEDSPTTNPASAPSIHEPFRAIMVNWDTVHWKADDVIELEFAEGFYAYCKGTRRYQPKDAEAIDVPELIHFSIEQFKLDAVQVQ